jgi:hypothetical protein
MSGLVIVPGWDNADADRFSPQLDTAYEQDLKACAQEGHADPVKVCPRCGEVLGEVEP